MNWFKNTKYASLCYGYWVDPDGETIPVNFEEHESILLQKGINNYKEAYDNGWIKITQHYGDFELEIRDKKPTNQQISAILNLYEEFAASQNNMNLSLNHIMININFKRYELKTKHGLKNILQSGQKPQSILASKKTAGIKHYGYWLKPNGELIPVTFENHEKTIAKFNIYGYSDAYEQGWVKITTAPNIMYVSNKIKEPNAIQKKIILELYEDINSSKKGFYGFGYDLQGNYIQKSSTNDVKKLLNQQLTKI